MFYAPPELAVGEAEAEAEAEAAAGGEGSVGAADDLEAKAEAEFARHGGGGASGRRLSEVHMDVWDFRHEAPPLPLPLSLPSVLTGHVSSLLPY